MRQGYTQSSDNECEIKSVQARIIEKLCRPQKLLIAGCSRGELIRQCRQKGMDAWGFDNDGGYNHQWTLWEKC